MPLAIPIKLTSAITQPNAPFVVGQVFKEGDVPAGSFLRTDVPNAVCVPLATWNDGSVKHAAIIGHVALTANVAKTITVGLGVNTLTGAALTPASIKAANPQASVQCGDYGTVELGPLLDQPPHRVFIATQEMIDAHYKQAIAGTNLVVWFYVRLFSSGFIRVLVSVENGFLDNGAGAASVRTDYGYIPTVIIGGQTVHHTAPVPITSIESLTGLNSDGQTQYWEVITTAVPHNLHTICLRKTDGMDVRMSGPRKYSTRTATTFTTPKRLDTSYGTYTGSSADIIFSHAWGTRWDIEGWIGTVNPLVYPSHETNYLKATNVVPWYAEVVMDEKGMDALIQTIRPLENGPVNKSMPAGGANLSIALLPAWDALYIGTGDARAYRAVLTGSRALNSFPIVWRDYETKDLIRPSKFSNWSTYGPKGESSYSAETSNNCRWELNHHPGIGFMAYLVTADYWHYETMALQVSAFWALRGTYPLTGYTGISLGTSRVIWGESRGTAWGIRSMCQLCGLMPDSERASDKIGSEYVELLTNNMNHWYSVATRPNINKIGVLYEYRSEAGTISNRPPWMAMWMAQSIGYGWDLQPLRDMVKFKAVRDFVYKFPVGMLGDSATGFPFQMAAMYSATVANQVLPNDVDNYFDTFKEIKDATFSSIIGGVDQYLSNKLLPGRSPGDPVPMVPAGAGSVTYASEGRWGYLLPAIAYAVKHRAPGADESWGRVTNAENYSVLVNSFKNQSYQWAVFPPTEQETDPDNGGKPTVPHANGPTIRLGELRPGEIILSKYHGMGTPVSDIARKDVSQGILEFSLGETKLKPNTAPDDEILLTVEDPDTGTLQRFEDTSFIYSGGAQGHNTGGIDILLGGVADIGSYDFIINEVVTAPVPEVTEVVISPDFPEIQGGESIQFTAQCLGNNNPPQDVTWTKTSGPGTLDDTGLYVAPVATNVVQTAVVRATSNYAPTKFDEVTITIAADVVVVPPPVPTVTSVTVTPGNRTMEGGTAYDFNAVAVGTNNPAQTFTWTITPAGIVDGNGLVTSPAAASTVQLLTLTARSTVDTTKTGTAVITVPAAVTDPGGGGYTKAHTVKLTIMAVDQQGNRMADAPITCSLNKVDVDAVYGYVAPEEIYVKADANGLAVLDLWPNVRGSEGSQYIIVIENPDTGNAMQIKATVPDRDCYLHQIALPVQ